MNTTNCACCGVTFVSGTDAAPGEEACPCCGTHVDDMEDLR